MRSLAGILSTPSSWPRRWIRGREATYNATSLAELVRARIGSLTTEAHQLLLMAACLAAPTVELVARAARTDPRDVIEQLADAVDHGIIEIECSRLRFAHPVLARGVYSSATPALAGRRTDALLKWWMIPS